MVMSLLVGGSILAACARAPKSIERYASTDPFKQRDTISRSARVAMEERENRRIVDSVLAAARRLPARPVGESLLAVDDSLDAALEEGAVRAARYTDLGYRGMQGRTFETLLLTIAKVPPVPRRSWVLCAREDTSDVARARVMRRVAARDSTRPTTMQRDYVRRDGRWYVAASAVAVDSAGTPCAGPLPRPTLPD